MLLLLLKDMVLIEWYMETSNGEEKKQKHNLSLLTLSVVRQTNIFKTRIFFMLLLASKNRISEKYLMISEAYKKIFH